jgi:hypothetical protein
MSIEDKFIEFVVEYDKFDSNSPARMIDYYGHIVTDSALSLFYGIGSTQKA